MGWKLTDGEAWNLADVNPAALRLLVEKTGHGMLDASRFPEAVQHTLFEQPLWIMRGRVRQFWKSAERYQEDLGPEISSIVSDAAIVNAYAIPDEYTPTISLTAGACVRIRQLMHQAQYCIGLFGSGGTGNDDPIEGELLSRSLDPKSSASILDPINLDPNLSDDDYYGMLFPLAPTAKRIKLADAMTRVAIDFLIMHELSHLLRKQNRFFHGAPSQAFFMESESRTSESLQPRGPILRQLLELDADYAATPLNSAMGGLTDEIPPMWNEWTNDPRVVFDLWLTSIALLFSFLDAWSAKRGSRISSHPPARVRLLAVASAALDRARESGRVGPSNEEIARLIFPALQRAATVWQVNNLPSASAQLLLGIESLPHEYGQYISKMAEYGVRTAPD